MHVQGEKFKITVSLGTRVSFLFPPVFPPRAIRMICLL
jgi:hypothetical protein